uniref:Uncharacterized protein n=1 Tax=Cacopsylla melanoneura TaxID=428564 RepID=A0A8D8SNR2_9HEMI
MKSSGMVKKTTSFKFQTSFSFNSKIGLCHLVRSDLLAKFAASPAARSALVASARMPAMRPISSSIASTSVFSQTTTPPNPTDQHSARCQAVPDLRCINKINNVLFIVV